MVAKPKTRYLYLVAHDYVPLMDNVLELYGGHPKVIAQKYDSYMSAAIDIELYGKGLIIYAITDMDHLKQIVSFTEGIKKFIRNKKVRIIVLHSVEHPKMKKLLRKIGCAEIFKTSVSVKFLQKLLEKYLGKAQEKEDEDDDVLFKSDKNSNKADGKDDVTVIKKSSPASAIDISDEMDEIDEIEESDTDEDVDISPPAAADLSKKIRNSKITGKFEGEKPKAIDFSIPDKDLDEEQKKIRSYYNEIFPQDEKNESGERKDSFGDVDSKEKKNSFMSESKDSGKPVTVWTRGREHLVHAQLAELDAESNIYIIQFKNESEHKELVKKTKAGQFDVIFVKLDISRGSIFFDIREPKNQFQGNGIKVTIPERMWRVDRRNFHRLQFPKNTENTVVLKVEGFRNGEEVERRLLNIGAGGAALGIFPNEIASFEIGTFIESFFFSVKGQELDCCAKVVWKEQFAGDSYVTVGVQFLGLDAEFIETINLFILEATFEFWERYHV